MRKPFIYLLCALLAGFTVIIQLQAQAPRARIAVIGSSTSYGQFGGVYPRDSGYVPKLEKYYRDLGQIDAIDNYGMSATDCYHGMPTGYVPPPNRNAPNPSYNITRALSAVPAPDIVIVNYPSNSYEFLSDEEIIFCLDSIKRYANERGVKCYITTSQPRDDWWSYENTPGKLCRLREIRDLILNYFGEFAIDFYTDVTGADCRRLPAYALEADPYHLNPAGHTLLRDKIIEKNILFGVVPIMLNNFSGQVGAGSVSLFWEASREVPAEGFRMMRSTDGRSFIEIAKVGISASGNYRYADHDLSGGIYFYRLEWKSRSGAIQHSKMLRFVVQPGAISIGKVHIAWGRLSVELLKAPSQQVSMRLINTAGQQVFKKELRVQSGTFITPTGPIPSGIYTLSVRSGNELLQRRVWIQ